MRNANLVVVSACKESKEALFFERVMLVLRMRVSWCQQFEQDTHFLMIV
jgi:hypothetical protein